MHKIRVSINREPWAVKGSLFLSLELVGIQLCMFHLLPGSTFVFVVHLTLFFAVIFKQWHLTWTVSWTYSCWIWWLAFGADVTFMVHWVLNVKNQSVDYTVASWLWAMYHSLHVFNRNQSICYDDGWCSSILHLATPPPSAPPTPPTRVDNLSCDYVQLYLPTHFLSFIIALSKDTKFPRMQLMLPLAGDCIVICTA